MGALFVAIALTGVSPSGPAGRIGVQVLQLTPEVGVDPESARLLTDFLVSELSAHKNLLVFGEGDLQTLLKEARERRELECNTDADSCLAEIAGAMGAAWLIGGSVGRLGDQLIVSLRLTDTHKRRMLAHASEAASGGTQALLDAVQRGVGELLLQAQPESSVSLAKPTRPVIAYVLASAAALAAVAWASTGVVAIVNASEASIAVQQVQNHQPESLSNYGSARGAAQLFSIVSDVALGVAVPLGLGAYFTW
ncbi:MAG: hypothetical protein ACYCWW_03815 [Deltaproteobacteria bacterium]